jgi:AraC-like DNA-binding protein
MTIVANSCMILQRTLSPGCNSGQKGYGKLRNMREAKREAQRVQQSQEELLERIVQAVPEEGVFEVLDDLFLGRLSRSMDSTLALYQPAFCLVLRGSKRILLGEEVLRYDPGHYLLFTVDLPVIFRLEDASDELPYVGLKLNLDPTLIASVMVEAGADGSRGDASVRAISVSPVNADLLDAVLRLVRLVDDPAGQRVLAPLVKREIVYRLLAGGEGPRLGHIVAADTRRISRVIAWLREHYDAPLRIEELAHELGMSVSGFHHHFKSVTTMSPLQFQKQIRLKEARRLMFGEDLDAATAGQRVGYNDPAYFSRDYKRLFGEPPLRDIARLRSSFEKRAATVRV